MKIAFDVQGTLVGKNSSNFQVRKLFYELHKMGHEITIWSNSYQYALDEKAKYEEIPNLQARVKFAKTDVEPENMMHLCFEDDRRQHYLGAYKIIYVDQLKDDFQYNLNLVQSVLKDINQ